MVGFWRKHVVCAPWFIEDKECLCVFLLNIRRRLIGFELVSQGTLDTLLLHPREVLRPVIFHNAAAFIIAHNHPSGDPVPSEGDVKATRGLVQAASQLKIDFLDHIIVGDARRKKGYASLRELGFFNVDVPAKMTDKAFDSLTELELAKNQSLALSQLMLAHESYRMKEGELSEEDRLLVNGGVYELVHLTNGRLDDAYDSIYFALNPKHKTSLADVTT